MLYRTQTGVQHTVKPLLVRNLMLLMLSEWRGFMARSIQTTDKCLQKHTVEWTSMLYGQKRDWQLLLMYEIPRWLQSASKIYLQPFPMVTSRHIQSNEVSHSTSVFSLRAISSLECSTNWSVTIFTLNFVKPGFKHINNVSPNDKKLNTAPSLNFARQHTVWSSTKSFDHQR